MPNTLQGCNRVPDHAERQMRLNNHAAWVHIRSHRSVRCRMLSRIRNHRVLNAQEGLSYLLDIRAAHNLTYCQWLISLLDRAIASPTRKVKHIQQWHRCRILSKFGTTRFSASHDKSYLPEFMAWYAFGCLILLFKHCPWDKSTSWIHGSMIALTHRKTGCFVPISLHLTIASIRSIISMTAEVLIYTSENLPTHHRFTGDQVSTWMPRRSILQFMVLYQPSRPASTFSFSTDLHVPSPHSNFALNTSITNLPVHHNCKAWAATITCTHLADTDIKTTIHNSYRNQTVYQFKSDSPTNPSGFCVAEAWRNKGPSRDEILRTKLLQTSEWWHLHVTDIRAEEDCMSRLMIPTRRLPWEHHGACVE